MDKKKILHILNTGEFSGAENVAITIIKNYSDYFQGIYMSKKGSIEMVLEKEEIIFYGVDKLSVYEIKKAIRVQHPVAIHAHDYTASILSVMATSSVPVISHIHNNVPWMRKVTLRSLTYRLIIKKIGKILVVSNSVITECWYQDLLLKKAICIGNPIDLNRIYKKKKTNMQTQLLFVGRLCNQKNPIQFLNIVSELVESGQVLSAVMLGRGELEEQCKNYIVEKNLEHIVQMKGFVPNPYDYMNYGTVLIMPSKWEGYGLVAVEALAFGVPVVANPVGGLKSIVTNECGYLVQDIKGEKKEIERLISDPQYYKIKSINAKKRAEEIQNIDEYMEKIEQIYIKLEVKRKGKV